MQNQGDEGRQATPRAVLESSANINFDERPLRCPADNSSINPASHCKTLSGWWQKKHAILATESIHHLQVKSAEEELRQSCMLLHQVHRHTGQRKSHPVRVPAEVIPLRIVHQLEPSRPKRRDRTHDQPPVCHENNAGTTLGLSISLLEPGMVLYGVGTCGGVRAAGA